MSEYEEFMSILKAELHIAQLSFYAAANHSPPENKVAVSEEQVILVEQLPSIGSNTNAYMQTNTATSQ